MAINVATRNTTINANAEHKVTRLFLKALDTNNTNADVGAGAYINLMTRYYWPTREQCDIDIGWETWFMDAEIQKTHYYQLTTEEFKQNNCITLEVAGIELNGFDSLLDDHAQHQILVNNSDNNYSNDTHGTLLEVNDQNYKPQLKLSITNITNENSKISIKFGYAYICGELTFGLVTDNSVTDQNYSNGDYYIEEITYNLADNVNANNFKSGLFYILNNGEYIQITSDSDLTYSNSTDYYTRKNYTQIPPSPYSQIILTSQTYQPNTYYIEQNSYVLDADASDDYNDGEHYKLINGNEYQLIPTDTQESFDDTAAYYINVMGYAISTDAYDNNTTYYTYSPQYDFNNISNFYTPIDGGSSIAYLVNCKGINSNTEYVINRVINILKPSRYDNNVLFNKDGLNEFVKNIKNYPIINIEEITEQTTWNNYTGGKPCLKVTYGNDTKDFSGYTKSDGTAQNAHTTGFQYVPVGSNIKFKDSNGQDVTKLPTTNIPDQKTGTFRVLINSDTFEVPIFGLSGGTGEIELGGSTIIDGNLLPKTDDTYDIGSLDTDPNTSGNQLARWRNLYLSGDIGASNQRIGTIYATTGNFTNITTSGGINSSSPLTITSTAGYTGAAQKPTAVGGDYGNNAISCAGGAYFAKNLSANRVYNAVFNDYAEFRTTINVTPGHVVIDQDDGSLALTTARLQPAPMVISDTFGHAMGATDNAQTPIAVAGRVLVYPYQYRAAYHAGMAVCSAPGGKVDIMTREEIINYPDCIVGYVSEIPDYETWGSDNVQVDGRIWIRVK